MDGLEALVKPIGPSMEGFNAGQETARKYEEQQNQQGLRQAQMQEILQNIEQRKQTNPLDLQSKQVKLQSEKLDAAIKQNETYLDFLGKAGTVLESVPALPGQRHAVLNQMLAGSGIDAKNPEVQQVMKQLEQVPADQLPKTLGTLRDRLVQTSSAYQQKKMEMDAHIKQTQITADASRYATDQRANAAAAKNKGVASIQEQVRSGKMTAEKAAVAMYGAAQFEADPTEQQKLLDMAKQYEQFAMNQRNAAAAGKVDVGAAANLPTQTLPPALGAPAPAAPAAPQHTLADVQKMYPNASAEQLRKAYKDKFGVDLK